jgi:hypothetical protein
MEARFCVEQTTLVIEVELRLHGAPVQPAVRMWVDSGSESDLQSETEVALKPHGPNAWLGSVTFEGALSFFYRLGISAAPGVDWWLRIHPLGSQRDLLVVDGDRLATAKSWLLGTCLTTLPDSSKVIDLDSKRRLLRPQPRALRQRASGRGHAAVVRLRSRRDR